MNFPIAHILHRSSSFQSTHQIRTERTKNTKLFTNDGLPKASKSSMKKKLHKNIIFMYWIYNMKEPAHVWPIFTLDGGTYRFQETKLFATRRFVSSKIFTQFHRNFTAFLCQHEKIKTTHITTFTIIRSVLRSIFFNVNDTRTIRFIYSKRRFETNASFYNQNRNI